MLLDAEQAVLILPGQTRYEQRGGGTTTNTERRIRFTPEIPGHQIGHSLPEWEIPAIIGRHAMPNGDLLFPYEDPQNIRDDELPCRLSRRSSALKATISSGGLFLHKAEILRAERRAFSVLNPPDRRASVESSHYRRGKQFNSMTSALRPAHGPVRDIFRRPKTPKDLSWQMARGW
jgi:hypothetical protein